MMLHQDIQIVLQSWNKIREFTGDCYPGSHFFVLVVLVSIERKDTMSN